MCTSNVQSRLIARGVSKRGLFFGSKRGMKVAPGHNPHSLSLSLSPHVKEAQSALLKNRPLCTVYIHVLGTCWSIAGSRNIRSPLLTLNEEGKKCFGGPRLVQQYSC